MRNLMRLSLSVFAIIALVTPTALAQKPDKPVRDNRTSLDLFDPADRASGLQNIDPGVVRKRNAKIRMKMFNGKGRGFGNGNPEQGPLSKGSVIILNLFDDVYYTAVLKKATRNASGSISWLGYLDGVDESTVAMVVNQDGVITGSVNMPDGSYTIRYAGDGIHSIAEVDHSQFPPDAEPIPVGPKNNKRGHQHRHDEPAPLEQEDLDFAIQADSSAVIDVLVVYTPAARSAAGGTSAMNSLIDLAMTETNDSYSNSNINTSVNLVHRAEVSYTESGNFSTDLGRLKSTSDGYMDNVHSLRDQYCADEVVLLIEGSQYCGIAYFMSSVSASFEDSAFAVVARTCATGYYSFGHEIGHNQGANHDWYVASNTAPYVYSHGFVNVTDSWRTVMAYNSECSASGKNCTRLKYWSNPNVNYGGDPMGVGGSSSGSAADNARVLNNTALTVANFRDSTQGCSTPGGCQGNYTGSGSLSGTGSYDYHPNGTYYYSGSSGTHEADLTGPAGADFDLYLWKWNGSGWSTVASSTSSGSNESISYSGSSGYYVWRVYSYSGSGSYDICADYP